jgi:hypothetical protein
VLEAMTPLFDELASLTTERRTLRVLPASYGLVGIGNDCPL